MNDSGADEAIKDLVESQIRQPDHGRFLSPTYHSKRSSHHNSETSSVSSVPTHNSQKENAGGLGPSRVHRTSCFWERFSHDSREEEDEEIENVRMSRNGEAGTETRGTDARYGNTSSNSPMREAEADPEGSNERGDEEDNTRELHDMENRGKEDKMLPGWHFLLSTAFPLMSATLGPVANVMSICALAVPWRVYIPPSSASRPNDSTKIADPPWCLALNAISLACGFAANVILLLNLGRRIQSIHLQPITITLWYIASVLLIALLIVYRRYLYHTPQGDHSWSQAYYYGIIGASMYFAIATLLVANYIGVQTGKYARQFTLTVVQRTLMLQTMSLMVWLCLGGGVFAKIEGWAFLDGIYFCDTTFLVVGLGDYVVTTTLGRALLFPYAAVGIVTVGLIVSSVRGLVLERGKRRVKRRLLEKQREVIIGGGKDGEVDKAESQKERFELMRKVQDRADQKRKWLSLSISVFFFLTFELVGALVFKEAEKQQKWTYFESLYFSYTTILTIGYGDFTPTSNAAKPFFVIWSLLAVPMMTILVSNLGDTVILIVKNSTLWLGEWTVLPGEKLAELGGRNRWLKFEGRRRKQQRIRESEEFQEAQRQRQQQRNDYDNEEVEEKRELERIGAGLVIKEEKEEQGRWSGEDANAFLLHDLASAVQKLLPDLTGNSPRQYSYEEWSSYLMLINAPDPRLSGGRTPGVNDPGAEGNQTNGETDWLGENSPLMSRQSETEWLLTKLCSRLEKCLREEKEAARRRGKGKARVEGFTTGSNI